LFSRFFLFVGGRVRVDAVFGDIVVFFVIGAAILLVFAIHVHLVVVALIRVLFLFYHSHAKSILVDLALPVHLDVFAILVLVLVACSRFAPLLIAVLLAVLSFPLTVLI
jgi:hypothetical protein